MSWWKYCYPAFAITWKEPRRFKQLKTTAEIRQPGSRVMLVKMWAGMSCALSALWFLAWLGAKLDPGGKPRSVALILPYAAGASAVVLAFSLLCIMADARFFPRRVAFARKWMGVLWEAGPRWRYDRIARVRFDVTHMGDEEFRVMVVTPRAGRESTLALSAEVDPTQIAELLHSKGVEVAEKT